MKRIVLAGAMCALAIAGGCASSPEPPEAQADGKPVYRTGSNIPSTRSAGETPGLSTGDRQVIEDMQRRPTRQSGGS